MSNTISDLKLDEAIYTITACCCWIITFLPNRKEMTMPTSVHPLTSKPDIFMKLGKNNMPIEASKHFMFIFPMAHKSTVDTPTCTVGIPIVLLIFEYLPDGEKLQTSVTVIFMLNVYMFKIRQYQQHAGLEIYGTAKRAS
jgi:hypothetical protein